MSGDTITVFQSLINIIASSFLNHLGDGDDMMMKVVGLRMRTMRKIKVIIV